MGTIRNTGDGLALRLIAILSTTRREREHRDDRDDRGDVPGWVLVTVMSVALVGILTKTAGPLLSQMLSDALSSVK